jgi:hypothetical protein
MKWISCSLVSPESPMPSSESINRKQIKSKRASLSKLKEQAEELKRLQAIVAAMPKIQADLQALERSLAILKGEEAAEPMIQTGLHEVMDQIKRSTREHSIPAQVYAVLRDAGKPLTGDQIMGLLAARGRNIAKPTVMGAIYRSAKNGKLFRLVAPGTFGLLEWPETKG